MSEQKWLLSVPIGGLNDTFCQLQKAWNYAQVSQRELVFDTRHSGVFLSFEQVFSVVNRELPPVHPFSRERAEDFDRMTTHPQSVQGQIVAHFQPEQDSPRLDSSQLGPLRLPQSVDVDRQLVVHCQGGGGRQSFRFLQSVALAAGIQERLESKAAQVPERYLAAHVRHTDYTTDLGSFFSRLRKVGSNLPIMVITDNHEVNDYAREVLPAGRLIQAPRFDLTSRIGALHRNDIYRSQGEKVDALLDSLMSLYLLSRASIFCYSTVQQPGKYGEARLSGFTRLARFLHGNAGVARDFFGPGLGRHLRNDAFSKEVLLAPLSVRIARALGRGPR